jgi:ABC-type tungstate transport system permease subunit
MFIFISFRCEAAQLYGDRAGKDDPVRIAEFLNSPAIQLLLVSINTVIEDAVDSPPAWQTLSARTEEERAALAAQGAMIPFDLVLTSDELVVGELFAQGELRSAFPIFSEELILVGPSGDVSGLNAEGIMGKIFSEELHFVNLMYNAWVWESERRLWSAAGVERPGDNKNYIESSRNDVTALFQAGDEGAYALVGEGSFAQYSDAQGEDAALVKIVGTGIYRKCYLCVTKSPASRLQRAAAAESLGVWFRSEGFREAIDNFEIGGVKAFKSAPPLY